MLATAACTVTVRDQAVVSPSTEIEEPHLEHLISGLGYRPVYIPSAGETLYGLKKTSADARATLVVLHGNAMNLSAQPWYGLLESLAKMDVSLLAIDYRGFGLSTGEASFSNMQADARAALALIPDDQQVILYGLSLGSVMAAELAGYPNVRGLIVEGAITDTEDMVAIFKSRKMFGSLFTVEVEDSLWFDTVDDLARLDKPVLVIHGEQDENIPFAFGETLFAATNHSGSEFYPVANGGHCDTFDTDRDHFLSRLESFVAASVEPSHLAGE